LVPGTKLNDSEGEEVAEPERIEVDHILIGVKSPRFAGKRGAADAKKVAYDLLAKLEAGGDWAKTKRENSEDPPPGGPYALSNRGVAPAKSEYGRDAMVPAFGNVGFALAVGEIGVADHDAKTSPFGYHLIKRTK
jgi:parvulin-like peptidyl-prolyl isomerase